MESWQGARRGPTIICCCGNPKIENTKKLKKKKIQHFCVDRECWGAGLQFGEIPKYKDKQGGLGAGRRWAPSYDICHLTLRRELLSVASILWKWSWVTVTDTVVHCGIDFSSLWHCGIAWLRENRKSGCGPVMAHGSVKSCGVLLIFLGPWGPLRRPLSVRPFVAHKTNLNLITAL